jgi:hypothetical protein
MSGYFITAAFCAVFIVALVRDLFRLSRRRRVYGTEWRAYNAGAFPAQVSPPDGRNLQIVTGVASEVISNHGRQAIIVQHSSGRGIAVHEINSAGDFSKRGPYFVKMRPLIWSDAGRSHLVEMVRPPGGFRASNPQGGTVLERGHKILEWNTKHYAPISLTAFAAIRESRKPESPAI